MSGMQLMKFHSLPKLSHMPTINLADEFLKKLHWPCSVLELQAVIPYYGCKAQMEQNEL